MPKYRLLFFRANRLLDWEAFEAADHLAAIDPAAGRRSDGRMELWSDSGRIAVFRPMTLHRQ